MERARHGETPTLLGPLGLEAEGPGVKPGRASAASRNGGGGGGEGPGGPVRCAPGEPLLGGGCGVNIGGCAHGALILQFPTLDL